MVDIDDQVAAPKESKVERAFALPMSRNWAPLAESALKQAGLAAAVLYGVVSLGYRSFYDTLGVRPEEVGVDRAHIVTQAAVALAFLLGLVSAIGVMLDLCLVPLGHGYARMMRLIRPRARTPLMVPPEGDAPRPVTPWLVGLIVLPATTATYLLYVAVPDEAVDAGTNGGRALALASLIILVLAVVRWRLSHQDARIQYKMWAVLAALLGVVALLVASGALGRAQARYLENTGHLAGTADAPASLISVTATCVQVTMVGSAPVPPDRNRVLLLGSSSGVDVMWDATTRQIVRLPATSVILRSCPSR